MTAAAPHILICALDPLGETLHDTLIWRDGLERHVATTYRDAVVLAASASPDLIVVDRGMPQAERLVEDLRLSQTTKEASIVVIADGPMNDVELGLLTAGANTVLRLPAGPAWEQKLGRLIEVPKRHSIEIPVRLGLKAGGRKGTEGTIVNLSETGALVECTAGLLVGDSLDLGFRLPPERDWRPGRMHRRVAGRGLVGSRLPPSACQARDGRPWPRRTRGRGRPVRHPVSGFARRSGRADSPVPRDSAGDVRLAGSSCPVRPGRRRPRGHRDEQRQGLPRRGILLSRTAFSTRSGVHRIPASWRQSVQKPEPLVADSRMRSAMPRCSTTVRPGGRRHCRTSPTCSPPARSSSRMAVTRTRLSPRCCTTARRTGGGTRDSRRHTTPVRGRVAAIVEGCTDTFEQPKPAWKARKLRFIEVLRSASSEVRRVAAADKLHDARTLLEDHRRLGDAVFDRFSAGKG